MNNKNYKKKPTDKFTKVSSSRKVVSKVSKTSPTIRNVVVLIICVFVITRVIFTFFYQTQYTDLFYYGPRAMQFKEGLKRDSSIYDYNKKMVNRNEIAARYKVIEYPPLTVLWMSIPAFFVNEESFTVESYKSWKSTFKFFYFLFDIFIFTLILIWFIKSSNLSIKNDIWGLSMYVISGAILFNLLYDRQDLWLGGIIFSSFLLLSGRLNWMFAFAVLAFGINFKLIPVIIAPIVILGSLPYNQNLINNYKQFILTVLQRIAFLLLMVLLIFLPFYILDGKPTLDFLSYQTERGIQLESTYSAFILLLSIFGLPVYITLNYGAFNLESSLSAIFVKLSTFIDVSLLICLFILLLYFIRLNLIKTINNKPQITKNFIQAMPQTFICFTIATLLLEISFSKVFSPQYILWIVPLFSLVSFKSRLSKITGLIFILVCILTTIIFPYIYFSDFATNKKALADGNFIWGTPTLLAIFILFIRNGLLITTSVLLIYMSKPKFSK